MIQKANKIVEQLAEAGARDCLLVGGWVRDKLMGRDSKDIDIEVYGLNYDQIVAALSNFRVNLVGKSFGVVKVDNSIDVSIPRRENKQGLGHKGFAISTDPDMSYKDALSRRDFTVNSIAMRLDGSLIDPFKGADDIKNRILRATGPAFREDPLRVLRGMQFASRLNFSMDDATIEMCREIHGEFKDLSRERLLEEWLKWTRGKYPAKGLDILQATTWLTHFPELAEMCGTEQDPEWHPEGDVFEHTQFVCDAAADIAAREGFDDRDRATLLFAALLHDVGKPLTSYRNQQGRWVSPGHASAGVPLAETFLKSIRAPRWLSDRVCPLVAEHMIHLSHPADQDPARRIVRRLANRLSPATIRLWAAVCEADHSGRPPLPKSNPVTRWESVAKELALEAEKPRPILKGKHLIKRGIQPGPKMGRILREAFDAQLDGKITDLNSALEWMEKNIEALKH